LHETPPDNDMWLPTLRGKSNAIRNPEL